MLVPGMGERGGVSPVVATELRRERNRFLKVSCFVLCLGFLPSPSFLYSLYDRKWLLFVWITFHAKEALSLLFSKSLTFPVAWAGSLQLLPDFESQRQFWLSKVVCSPPLYPAFASGEEAGHNSRTGTIRSFSFCDKLWLRAFGKQGAEKHCPSQPTEAEGFLLLQCITAQLACPYCAVSIPWALSKLCT